MGSQANSASVARGLPWLAALAWVLQTLAWYTDFEFLQMGVSLLLLLLIVGLLAARGARTN